MKEAVELWNIRKTQKQQEAKKKRAEKKKDGGAENQVGHILHTCNDPYRKRMEHKEKTMKREKTRRGKIQVKMKKGRKNRYSMISY